MPHLHTTWTYKRHSSAVVSFVLLLAAAVPPGTHALLYKQATQADGWKCGATFDDPKNQYFNLPALTITYCPSNETDLAHSYCLQGKCQAYPSLRFNDNCQSTFTSAGWPNPAEQYKCQTTTTAAFTVPGQYHATQNSKTVLGYYTDINQQVFCGVINNRSWACPSDLYCCFPELIPTNETFSFKDDAGKLQPVYRCAATPRGQAQPNGTLGMCMQYNISAAAEGSYAFIKAASAAKPAEFVPLYFVNNILNDLIASNVPPANRFSYTQAKPVLQGVGVDYSTGRCIPGYGRVGPPDMGASMCVQCPFGFYSTGGQFGEAVCQACPPGLTTQAPGAISIGFCTDDVGTTYDFPVQYTNIGSGCYKAGPWITTTISGGSKTEKMPQLYDISSDQLPEGFKHSVTTCVKWAAMYASYYTWVVTSNTSCYGGQYNQLMNYLAYGGSTSGGLCNTPCPGNSTERCGYDGGSAGAVFVRAWRILPSSYGDFGRPQNLPYYMSNDKCDPYGSQMMQCAPQQFIGVPEPAAPATSKGAGILGVLSGVGKVMGVLGDTSTGYGDTFESSLAKKAGFGLTSVSALGGLGFGIWGAVRSKPKAKEDTWGKGTAWLAASLNKDLSYMSDYLTCNMQALIGYSYYAAVDKLDGKAVKDFNNGIRSLMVDATSSCQVYNCLNHTLVDPAARNSVSGLECCREIGIGVKDLCKRVKWDPSKQIVCTTGDASGVCGSDNKCYSCENTESAIRRNRDALDKFSTMPGIANFVPLKSARDVNSTLAYATGALVKLVLLQQGSLLGDTLMPSEMLNLARQVLPELRLRYAYNTDVDRILATLRTYSTTGGTPTFECLCNDTPNEKVGAWCDCSRKSEHCGEALVTDVATCSKCAQNPYGGTPSLDSLPNYCDQTKGTGQIIIASGCLRTQTYAALGCVGGRASCTALQGMGTCEYDGTSACDNMENPIYWGGDNGHVGRLSSCAYLGSTCSGAVLNSGKSKDLLDKALVDRDTIKKCSAGVNCRDSPSTVVDKRSICNGFSLPFVTSDLKTPDTNWADKTTKFFDTWTTQNSDSKAAFWQPNTNVCSQPHTEDKVDGVDNPYGQVDKWLPPLAQRIAHANTEQLLPVLGVIRLFDTVVRRGASWARQAKFFQGAFTKYGSTRYDCTLVSQGVPPEDSTVGAAAAASTTNYVSADDVMTLDAASLPDFNCSTPQADHWVQIRGVDAVPRLQCQAGYFLSSSGCCVACPRNSYKQLPGNAPSCARCDEGMVGSERWGSTFCVPKPK